jgi:cell pole-organizing protein PopZ
MTAENAQREPTMEEILASIRRIISEEDQPAEEGGDVLELQPSAPEAAAPAPAPAPAAKAPEPEPAFELAQHVERHDPPAAHSNDDLMIVDEEEPEPAPPPPPKAAATAPQPVHAAAHSGDTLVSGPVATQAAGALGRLMGSMLVSTGGTLDDVVRELLKPMLKDWLDANLPAIVESEVAKEIERIRRMAR